MKASVLRTVGTQKITLNHLKWKHGAFVDTLSTSQVSLFCNKNINSRLRILLWNNTAKNQLLYKQHPYSLIISLTLSPSKSSFSLALQSPQAKTVEDSASSQKIENDAQT